VPLAGVRGDHRASLEERREEKWMHRNWQARRGRSFGQSGLVVQTATTVLDYRLRCPTPGLRVNR
jgi:hypothetical protein